MCLVKHDAPKKTCTIHVCSWEMNDDPLDFAGYPIVPINKRLKHLKPPGILLVPPVLPSCWKGRKALVLTKHIALMLQSIPWRWWMIPNHVSNWEGQDSAEVSCDDSWCLTKICPNQTNNQTKINNSVFRFQNMWSHRQPPSMRCLSLDRPRLRVLQVSSICGASCGASCAKSSWPYLGSTLWIFASGTLWGPHFCSVP